MVDRARRGDRDAFGELVRKYQDRIVNYARALVSDAADAEDIGQETFLRAYRALGRFRRQSLFKTWLYQIATNVARTALARRRARAEDGRGSFAGGGEPALVEPPSPEDVEATVVNRDRIDRALAALPEDLRQAVVLRDVEGFEYREIAGLLEIPIGTVESRIFRARERLREALAPGE
jgi:RNA polymerase sigma-70 factor (ECF subfamily)